MSYSIMIVDDEPMTRMLLRFMLSRAGFKVIEAIDGEDALSRMTDMQPDAMVLDLMMPGINGIDLCKRVRDMTTMPSQMPIIILSGIKMEPDHQQNSLQAGVTRILSKPISAADLTMHIHEVLN